MKTSTAQPTCSELNWRDFLGSVDETETNLLGKALLTALKLTSEQELLPFMSRLGFVRYPDGLTVVMLQSEKKELEPLFGLMPPKWHFNEQTAQETRELISPERCRVERIIRRYLPRDQWATADREYIKNLMGV